MYAPRLIFDDADMLPPPYLSCSVMKLFLITSAALASVAFAYADSGNNQLLIQTSLVTLVDPWTHWNSFIASQVSPKVSKRRTNTLKAPSIE